MRKFIKLLSILIFIALCFFGMTSTTANASVSIRSITLAKKELKLELYSSTTLKINTSPKNASNQEVTWSSNDKKIVTVNAKGEITAKNEGTATVTAKTLNGKAASCKVTVYVPSDTYTYKDGSHLEGYTRDYFKKEIFNWYAHQWGYDIHSEYSVYQKAIKKIFPNGTENLKDWEIVRNVCYWAVNDFVDNGKNSMFKAEYKYKDKNYLNRLNYSNGLLTTGEIVQRILGFLGVDVLWYYNNYNYPIMGVKLDGDWYYCILKASYDFEREYVSIGHLFEPGEFIKTQYYDDFVDILGANHHEYCNGCKVWYIDSIDYLTTEEGIKEFCARMEESIFAISGRTYMGIGIGIKKNDCKVYGLSGMEYILAKDGDDNTYQKIQTQYDNIYSSIWYSTSYENELTLSNSQLISACIKKMGYSVLNFASLGGGDKAHSYNDYMYDASIVSVEPAIALSQYRLNLCVGDTVTLIAIDITQDTVNQEIVWSSSDNSIATVDANGTVTCLDYGDVEITATLGNKKSAYCFIQVTHIYDE